MNQCIRLANSLVEFSKYRPVVEVKLATVGIFSILGNIRSVSDNCFILILFLYSARIRSSRDLSRKSSENLLIVHNKDIDLIAKLKRSSVDLKNTVVLR